MMDGERECVCERLGGGREGRGKGTETKKWFENTTISHL